MMVKYGEVEISWLGHDGFLLQGSKIIYIDPYEVDMRDKPAADFLLITHSHYDHLSIPDIERVITPNTTVICPPDCSSKLTKFKMHQLKTFEPGDAFEEEGVRITAIPAYNVNKKFHPRENDWLGYLVTMDDVTVYHSGDTDLIPEMQDIECNIALLPVSGTYVMTAEEAAQAADMIGAEVVIPMHWGSIIGERKDAEEFRKLWKGKTVILDKE